MDIGVLGQVELRSGTGQPVPVAGARLRTLLIMLALEAGRIIPAARLIDGVWGDDPPGSAGGALQALIARLRRTAPGLAISTAPTGYRLDLDRDRVDAHRFTRLAEQGRAARDAALLRSALGLWRGPVEFPETLRADRVRLERLRLDATQERIAIELRSGRTDIVPELESLTATHPLHEDLAALLMRAHVSAGNAGRALEVFERIRAGLADSLGADPSPALAALHLETLRGQPARVRGNLPAPVSSFVGREDDLVSVRALLGAHRLVTLTGPGGSGKTRLGVEAAATLAPGNPDGVWRVELAPLTDPEEVPQAVLTALGLRSQVRLALPAEPADPVARLRESLSGRRLLLVLDNCEHLIDAAAALTDDLLRAAPGLRVLATSREPLTIPGEQIFAVEPLALPPDESAPDVGAAPAVRLLLDRAGPGFVLDASTVAAVVRICRALDGMPLAIELAAARLRTLPAAVLAERLGDRFRLLTTGSRTALPRHQTLRAVVDWSWDLLGEDERALWRRFSVFPGGADVTTAERVCDSEVTVLGALTDKSLLVRDGDRYRMLETIREYGRERLAEAGETERVRLAHARHMLELAERAEPLLRSADQLVWLRRLSAEHDNMHAAVRMAIEAGDPGTATALVARLGWYWWLRGHRTEGYYLSREVIALDPADVPGEDLALAYCFMALNGLEGAAPIEEVTAWFLAAERWGAGPDSRHPVLRLLRPLAAIYQAGGRINEIELLADDPDPWLRALATMITAQLRLNFGMSAETARAEMREALDGFRAVGDRWGMGFSLSFLGDVAAARGDFTAAVAWQREAIALVREVGIREDLPQMEVKLAGRLHLAGDPAAARHALAAAQLTAAEIGEPITLASVEFGYATLARAEGHLDEARTRTARTMTLIERATFAPQFKALVTSAQALIEAEDGNLPAARHLHETALRTAVDAVDAPVVAQVLTAIGDYALRCNDPAEAARLLGAADKIRGATDHSTPDLHRITTAARQALGDAAFAQAYATGTDVTLATAQHAITTLTTAKAAVVTRADADRSE
ncbi:BTAD domain-containing putative transcriptional regulator [Winogradskya humida]|uniref:SARP family transcriptional regulator n=1 Tax=Winogradskya humida TaxID=113566 RepID=A0ABQ3ZGI7_9ACTN|nr:BTAD domain-containing putative transcriptional regulator [Actinoplanes humidus]GIE17624.1 SARP family transcriptional regulator [Actinoplanes humidus]